MLSIFLQSLVLYSILSHRCEIIRLLKVSTFTLFFKNQILFTVQKKHWNKPTKTWPKAKVGRGLENVVNFLLFRRKQK